MEMEDKYCEYAVKNAAQTLIEAEEIKKDPKMMGLVKAEMEKSVNAIKSIKELRKIASAKMKPEAEMEEEEGEDEDEVPAELMTDEDKAAKQTINKQDKRAKDLGFTTHKK